MRSPLLLGMIGLLFFATEGLAQQCETRYASHAVNVRSGPGTDYGVVGSIGPTASGHRVSTEAVRASGHSWTKLCGTDRWVAVDVLQRGKPQQTGVSKMAVYQALVRYQDQAYCDAQRTYPGDIQAQASYSNEKDQAAYGVVARRYGISERTVRQLSLIHI